MSQPTETPTSEDFDAAQDYLADEVLRMSAEYRRQEGNGGANEQIRPALAEYLINFAAGDVQLLAALLAAAVGKIARLESPAGGTPPGRGTEHGGIDWLDSAHFDRLVEKFQSLSATYEKPHRLFRQMTIELQREEHFPADLCALVIAGVERAANSSRSTG